MTLAPGYTADPETLKQVFVINDSGKKIPLSAFADITSSNAALSVAHQGQSATSTIAFNLAPGVSLGQASTAISRALVTIGLPRNVQAGFQGTAKEFEALSKTMMIASRCHAGRVLGICCSAGAIRQLIAAVCNSAAATSRVASGAGRMHGLSLAAQC